MTDLAKEPYNLLKGELVVPQVRAKNLIGWSEASNTDSKGLVRV
jgi:hypothetical protein